MIGEMWWLFLIFTFVLSALLRYDVLLFASLLLALASGASLLSFLLCLRGVVYRRRLSDGHIFSGEETELTLEITNAKPLPLAWLLVRDRFPPGLLLITEDAAAGGQHETSPPDLKDMLVLRRYERVQRTYRVRGHRRGVYTFDSVTLTAGNLFGLEHKSVRLSKPSRLVVYPKVVPVEGLALPLERPAGRMKARRRIVEDPLRIASVREYVPGDSVRYIHWKNTARRNQLQTKVFDPEASQVLTVFADLQTSHDPYSAVSEYLELVISSAASIAVHALGERHSVGLCVNGGPPETRGWTFIPPGRHPQQGMQILEALAPLQGFRTLSLDQLLQRSMPALPYGSTVLVITARMTELVLLSLLMLEDAGHPAGLFTVGDRRPIVPGMFTTFHLGGRDAWRNLEALALA